MLSVVMLNVIVLNVIMLSVAAPVIPSLIFANQDRNLRQR
jgi:hypothetical protein